MEGCRVLLFWGLLLSVSLVGSAIDTIIANQSITDGETLVSTGGSFRLGFFSPSDSKSRYLAMWYNNIATQTVVWVANRETPLNDTKGMLKVTQEGLLVILNGTENIIWSSNSTKFTSNPVVQLMESGNLVLKDGNDNNPDHFFWQSFDHPSETLLPGMKLGINKLKNQDVYLSSWKTGDDPAHGHFKYHLNSSGYPQVYITDGSIVVLRLGPWNGVGYNGMPSLKPNPFFTYGFVFTQEETYYSYHLINTSVVTRLVLNPNGIIQRFVWINRTGGWLLYTNTPTDNCDTYALCGAYGSCNIANSPACGCLKGFVPKSAAEWGVADWSNGCVRKTQLDCGETDGFITYSNVKFPDTQKVWFNDSMNLEECKTLCAKNCTCTAYSNMDVRNAGSGCFLWFGDLLDIREYTKDGQNLYVKMASSELGRLSARKQRGRIIAISISVTGVLVLATGMVLYLRGRKKQGLIPKGYACKTFNLGPANESQKDGLELQFFELETIADATNNFSQENEIGRGGFGPVYKGVLPDGREVAVKKLSEESEQGNNEFDNEVMYIARLQHRNLVKLLGYCQQGKEKMLIYEYMKNRSLDGYLFGRTQHRLLLDWSKRFHIIRGIARGFLYLHQDSRLRIVHRDLKAGNILLDSEMNPKISDFGTARSFGGSETEANTRNVVGTHGYISPEYAMDGLFSVKSDVFSFGVLLLEIISGMTNRRSPNQQNRLSLVGHAWKLFNEGRSNELIDASIESSGNLVEVLRCVHVGLLCVQQCAQDRPNMASVILMLEGESALPPPEQPGFHTERNLLLEAAIADSSSSKPGGCSINMNIFFKVSLTCVLVLAVGLVLYMWERKKLGLITNGNPSDTLKLGPTSDSQKEDLELQCFYFPAIVKATNNFSQENEVGRGGFGPVYKGVLPDGQEIAVKKLSEDSEQGNNEFRNEVMYIARLQHRNLVKLLGYCLQGTEKMLIYEFMKNRSLDVFIFGRTQHRLILDWSKRLNIITGIARGLLYLHQDSRLRIVHRDLKAGNILLDSEMNPKISDFGTARSFGGNETEANTRNVVGSHGYISPEYAMDGLFSVKSDVFSFGVLVLEIVSGKTNRRSENQQHRLNLVGNAWKLFQEGRSNELIDATIESSSDSAEVLRAVHVGLLCVQQCAQDRPNMASVVRILEGESALPQPQQPGFYTERNLLLEAALKDSSSSKPEDCSINMVTITLVKGR